jgi:hypothetical protein
MDKNELMERQIDLLEEMYLINLERKIEGLISDLQIELNELRRCKEKGIKYTPNSCGIVQGQGVNVDELCIKLGVLDAVKKDKNFKQQF